MLDKTSPSVAVVVLNWNGLDHLKTYLPSVLSNTPAWAEVWVADNGSTDGSLEWVSGTHGQRIRTLALGENWGFAEGYNRALNQVKADVFVLLNSDVRIDGPWLEPMLAVMDREGWDVASPRVVQDVNPSFCEHAGAAGGWMDVDGYPFCLGRLFESVEEVDDWHRQDREVFWASGACFFIRREAWAAAGGFDGSLFAHMEEIDLCWRLKNAGKRVGCAGTVEVRHLGGGTLQTTSPFKTYLNFRNNLVVMLKNRPGFWPGFMFRRMALDGIAAWKMLLSGNVRQFWAVGQAHGAFYLRLRSTLRVRRELSNMRTAQNDLVGWWNHSVVWAYFVQRRRRARDLGLPGH
ncbi:MAG: glycosyltransferase family 2 protein [Bacteroidetes bacterium]|nr:glycosyltransferase family 2 protein [Bacteroidota bacterium]